MDYRTITEILKSYIHRNHIILSDKSNRVKPNTVNLHWWKLSGEYQNVGDMLSPVVLEFILRQKGLSLASSHKHTSHLYAIGSIIDGGYQNATVWGSGLLRGRDHYWWRTLRKLDIRAVRGPLTRQTLIKNGYSCPEVYGDPAILMPMFFRPANSQKRYAYRVIPHMTFGNAYPNILSPYTKDWKHFISELIQSELIISSSLHGIILAEAYGIPAILLNDQEMNLFKYQDYYYATGRDDFPLAHSVEEALSMSPAPLPDLSALSEALLNSFPADLWE